MRALGGIRGYEELHRFIADPRGTVPGTAMHVGRVADAAARTALIAHLRTPSDDPLPLP